jgi:hypothetical protein
MLAAGVPIAPGFGAMAWKSGGGLVKRPTMKNFLDALVAVLAGNAIYFLLMPHLPAVARHALFKEDWGLLVDFLICAAIFAAVKCTRRREG